MRAKDDPIAAPPVLDTDYARVWHCDLTTRTERDCTIAEWLVEAIWAHPNWHSYVITIVHLRPAKGVPPATIYLPDATHELWVHALDPLHARQTQFESRVFHRLEPVNFVAQMKWASDEEAIQFVQTHAIQTISKGALSPDDDFIEAWGAIFGRNMIRSEKRLSLFRDD